jgi:hypothetical protein
MGRTIVGLLVAFALGIAALDAHAQTEKWDQAKVTTLAAEYEGAVSGLRDAVRQSIAWTENPDKSKLYQIAQDLRQIEWLAQSLHADLKKGEGLEATTPVYLEMVETRNYAQADAMFVDINAQVKPKLDTARAAFAKLSAFYPQSAPKGAY